MSQLNDSPQTLEILQGLASPSAARREGAAKKAAKSKNSDARVVTALAGMAANDANPYPREAARRALVALGQTPPPVAPDVAARTIPPEPLLTRDFFIGFGAWLVLNLVLLLLLLLFGQLRAFPSLPLVPQLLSNATVVPFLIVVPLLANLAGLVLLATRARKFAFGALVAFTLLLFIVYPVWLLFASALLPNP